MNRIKEAIIKLLTRLREDRTFCIRFILVSAVILVIALSGTIIAVMSGRPDESGSVSESEDSSLIPLSPTPVPSPTVTPAPTPTPTPEPTPTPDLHVGQARSYLTGEWKDEQTVASRPYSIMLNNIGLANPQSGIGDAVILYEALTEAGITRLMGLFEGLSSDSSCADRIGSVRSARHYFASIADEYDSIFIHYGETTYATKKIKKLALDHLEGTYGIGETVFYRDKNIKAPHNAFASLEGILKGIEKMNIRTAHEDKYTPNHFVFNDEEDLRAAGVYKDEEGNETVSGSSKEAVNIKLDYSEYMKASFEYDPGTGLYTRSQFNGVHTDYNTGEPLKFTNLIIQIVHEYNKDKNGYQEMDISDNSGSGYYISMGRCVPVTWKKNEKKKTMFYYDENMNVLSINPGRTFISIYPDFRESRLIIE
ncbi:MAG: DUF3048 domain-containing protein [Lachnospiraceae bacterium]|nr:DUF3048 domain-containing protein [Lachnospiraceae bacterium]